MPTVSRTTSAASGGRSRRSPVAARLFRVGALSILFLMPADTYRHLLGRPAGYAGPHVARFEGVDANRRDLVWRGEIADAAAGDSAELRLVLAPRVSPADAARPTPWPVDGVLFVSGAPERSFAADVAGTVDWRAHRADLQGAVSVGPRKGERVTYTASVDDFDLRGDLHAAVITAVDAWRSQRQQSAAGAQR